MGPPVVYQQPPPPRKEEMPPPVVESAWERGLRQAKEVSCENSRVPCSCRFSGIMIGSSSKIDH